MEPDKAYEILGLKENASRNEIERRYAVLLKRRKAAEAENDSSTLQEVDIEKITGAYNFLMGYEEPIVEEVPSKASPILKKAGIDEKKAKNFWYYYRFHILGGIVLLLVIAFSLKSCITAEKPDFNLAYIGDIYLMENDLLKDNIKNAVPEIKTPGIDGAMLSKDADGQQQYAMQMKVMVLLAAADVDLFIVDKEAFANYAKQGAFISLDEYADELGVDKSEQKDFIVKPDDAGKEGLYAIDISSSKLLKDSKVLGKSLVAAVPVKSKHIDSALKLIKILMEE